MKHLLQLTASPLRHSLHSVGIHALALVLEHKLRVNLLVALVISSLVWSALAAVRAKHGRAAIRITICAASSCLAQLRRAPVAWSSSDLTVLNLSYAPVRSLLTPTIPAKGRGTIAMIEPIGREKPRECSCISS